MNSRNELRLIADSLRSLKNEGIIRTKNLVGDLGEYYCKELLGLTVNENVVQLGFDAIDKAGKRVEVKTRRTPEGKGKVVFRNFEFEYCLYVELNEYFEPIMVLKIDKEEIKKNVENNRNRISVRKIKNQIKSERVY